MKGSLTFATLLAVPSTCWPQKPHKNLRVVSPGAVLSANRQLSHKITDKIECIENYKCIPLSRCRLEDLDGIILYPCHYGLNLVCCPPGAFNSSSATVLDSRKTSLFPVDCGLVEDEDRIISGQNAQLGQFPWMALLGYTQRDLDFTQFLCGGSLITDNFVLTAAHCISLDRRLELVVVRLGEHDLSTPMDCFSIPTVNTTICADRPLDNPVKQIIQHPGFNSRSLENDIALIRTRIRVKFTEFIKPVCLPFDRNLANITRYNLTVSGWGKTNAANIGGSLSLQYASVRVWNQTMCNKTVPPEVSPIKDTQICANGGKQEDACKGDSGGPLVYEAVSLDGMRRNFQLGIVSFASTSTCGNPKLPTVYTRVDKYLGWIIDNVS